MSEHPPARKMPRFVIFKQDNTATSEHPYTRFEVAFADFKKVMLQHRDRVFYLCIQRPGDAGWVILLSTKDLM